MTYRICSTRRRSRLVAAPPDVLNEIVPNTNATMYREAGARRGVHFNPECPHSVLPTVERGLKSEPKNKDTSTQCMLEN